VKCEGLEIATCLQYLVRVKESPRHTNCPHPLIPTTIPQPPASNLNSPLYNMFDLLNMLNLLLGLVALLFQLAFALALSAAGIITFVTTILYIHSLIPRAPTPLDLLEARIKGPSPEFHSSPHTSNHTHSKRSQIAHTPRPRRNHHVAHTDLGQ
jgi:hypothetical protein